MKVAVLIDGAFLRKKFHAANGTDITPQDVKDFADKLINKISFSSSDSHRVYFYECRPCDKKVKLPITKTEFDFSTTPQYVNGMALLEGVRSLPYFAVREGQLSLNGWKLKRSCYNKSSHTDSDFVPDLEQKGVDIKIGLDIAWISYNRITENIILVTADSDFVPAVKTARKNGVFVHLFTLAHSVKPELKANADICYEEEIKSL